jgi:hypothetical protein
VDRGRERRGELIDSSPRKKPDIETARSDQYRLDRLIQRPASDAKVFDWSDEITADCPRKLAKNLNDMCGARCPDLPKVV